MAHHRFKSSRLHYRRKGRAVGATRPNRKAIDLQQRCEAAQERLSQRQALQQRDEELHAQNLRFELAQNPR